MLMFIITDLIHTEAGFEALVQSLKKNQLMTEAILFVVSEWLENYDQYFGSRLDKC